MLQTPESTCYREDNTPLTPHRASASPLLTRYVLLVGSDVIGKSLAYLSMLIVVWRFGAAGYGAFSFAASVIICALTAAALGLDTFAARETARHPERIEASVGTIVALRLSFGASVYVMLLLGAMVTPFFGDTFELIAVLGLSLLVSAMNLNWIAEGQQRSVVLAVANMGTQGFNLLLLLVVIYWHRALWGVAIAQVAAEIAVGIGLFAWANKSFRISWKVLSIGKMASIITESAPIGWSRVMRAVTISSDIVILGFLLPFEEVGWYSGANRLYMLFLTSVGLYSILLLPRLSACATAGSEPVWKEVRASFRRILPLALVCVAATAVIAQFLLVTMFDPTFAAATTSLQLLLVSLFISLVSGHFRLALIALNRQKEDSIAVTLTTVAHIILKLAFVPLFGITGAALGTCAGELFLLGAMVYLVRSGRSRATPKSEG